MPEWLPRAAVAIVLAVVILLIAQRYVACSREGLCLVNCRAQDRRCFALWSEVQGVPPKIERQ